ncbi:ABC transporter permease [Isoptericola aurantiacus]|uniref:ABC transporter permease n=1 Tax=Isoptericola aurantiacus TaxID=3377839 RepID=UPI00383A8527
MSERHAATQLPQLGPILPPPGDETPAQPSATPDLEPTSGSTRGSDVRRRMRRSTFFMVGAVGFAVVVLLCAFGPFVLPFHPNGTDIPSRLVAPEWFAHGLSGHILGTDALGRDVLTRVLVGGRTSLFVALTIVVVTTVIGLVLGLASGYFGGVLDLVVMRLCDLGLAIPALLLAIAVAATIGGGVLNLIVVLSLTGWIMMARVVRSTVMSVRNLEFVQAAKVFGLGDVRIIVHDVLPNIVSPMVITATQAFGAMLLSEASLSFLGLGIPSPAASWGGMIADGREYIATAPWVVLAPGLALMLAVLAVNYVGDGLNDILNPRRTD